MQKAGKMILCTAFIALLVPITGNVLLNCHETLIF